MGVYKSRKTRAAVITVAAGCRNRLLSRLRSGPDLTGNTAIGGARIGCAAAKTGAGPTPAMATTWVSQKLTAEPKSVAIVYTDLSEWPAVQQAIATLPSGMQSQVRWWIADPTGYPHVVPGSSATQWYWGQNYDISTAEPGF